MKKILFVCICNTCRLQMAGGIANNLGQVAYSAGTNPELNVNPHAIKVMGEIGLDISNHKPKLIDEINFNKIGNSLTKSNERNVIKAKGSIKKTNVLKSSPDGSQVETLTLNSKKVRIAAIPKKLYKKYIEKKLEEILLTIKNIFF